MLTKKEEELVDKIGSLLGDFKQLVEDAVVEDNSLTPYSGDFNEIVYSIHNLQNWVLANAAARGIVKYRFFGTR